MARAATEQLCQFLQHQPPHRNWDLPTFPFLTLKGQDFAPVRWRKSTKSTYSYRSSYKTRLGLKIASGRLLRQWPPKLFGASWLASLLWKQMQLLVPAALTQQDLGTCLDRVTAPQPLGPSGPMAQGHPMTIGKRDVDLILFKTWRRTCTECLLLTVPMWTIPHWDCSVWENQTFQCSKNPSEFIAKQVPCRPDSYSKQEASVRTLWPYVKMMVCPMKLTVLSAAPKQLSRYANPNHLKTERSGSNLRLCGECWPNSSKFSSLMEMTKVHLLPQRSMLVHKFSASEVEETELENLCSNLHLLEVVSCSLLLHLTCVFLVFLVKCCDGSPLKPALPMCDGRRPFAFPLFRRLVGRGTLFRGFPFRWVLHLALSLTRSITVHDATLYSREDPLYDCGRPCDNLSCLFFTACGFGETNPHWYSRFSEPRISIWLATKRCIRWTFVYFWKSTICTNKLDDTQPNRSRAYISWCRFSHGWNTSSWSLGFG